MNSDPLIRSPLARYGAAVGAVALGLLLRLALTAWVGPELPLYITFYPAVMVAALVAGLGPGLLATGLAALAVDYLILEPGSLFSLGDLSDLVGQVLFCCMGALISTGAHYLHQARRKAAAYDQEQALRHIRQEKEFLANLLEHASQPFAVGFSDGRLGRFNQAYAQLTGYTAAELRALDWPATLTPPEWRELETQKLNELHLTGQPVRYEKEYLRKDGTRVPIELLVHLARDAAGQPEYYYSFLTDITARKQAEDQLLELSQRLTYHVNNSPLAVIEWGPDMRLIRWSGEAERLFGWQAGEVLGKRMGDFRWIYEEDQPQVGAVSTELAAGTNPRRFSTNRNYRKDGSVVHCEWYNSSLLDESGKLRSILSLVLDVTARQQAEQALRESEARYRAIGESINYGVWVCAPDGRNTYASESFLKLVGLTQEQCSNFGWGEVLHPDDADRTLAAWKECSRTGGQWDIEHRFRGVDGQYHDVLARGVPIRNERGDIVCWVGINLDISRLKQAEARLKASLNEKEVLLKEIHHRVKNNLQIITSLVSLQADTLNDPALRELFQNVRDRVRSMALVHEKLYQSEDLAQVDFADYARSLLHYLWRAQGRAAQAIRLNLELQPVKLSAETAAPCGLLLNELASNALKHAFRGRAEGEVTVGLERDPATHRVCLRVSDNGPGLPPDLDWRQSPTLGLRLVQMLTQQIHGTVEVRPGPGAEFRVVFAAPPVVRIPNNL